MGFLPAPSEPERTVRLGAEAGERWAGLRKGGEAGRDGENGLEAAGGRGVSEGMDGCGSVPESPEGRGEFRGASERPGRAEGPKNRKGRGRISERPEGMVAKPDRKPVGETGNAWNTAEPRANWGNLRAGGQWAGLRKGLMPSGCGPRNGSRKRFRSRAAHRNDATFLFRFFLSRAYGCRIELVRLKRRQVLSFAVWDARVAVAAKAGCTTRQDVPITSRACGTRHA